MKTIGLFLYLLISTVALCESAEDVASRIVNSKLSHTAPSDRPDPAELGRFAFFYELLKPQNHKIRIFYALMLAQDEEMPRKLAKNLTTADERGEKHKVYPMIYSKDGDVAILRAAAKAIKQEEAEQPGAAQPATKPADKTPGKGQPSTPTPKDGPR
jgi:hypothetical protein